MMEIEVVHKNMICVSKTFLNIIGLTSQVIFLRVIAGELKLSLMDIKKAGRL